ETATRAVAPEALSAGFAYTVTHQGARAQVAAPGVYTKRAHAALLQEALGLDRVLVEAELIDPVLIPEPPELEGVVGDEGARQHAALGAGDGAALLEPVGLGGLRLEGDDGRARGDVRELDLDVVELRLHEAAEELEERVPHAEELLGE